MLHSKKIYDNCTVLHADGTVMFRCNKKKLDWYLRKGLAKKVDGKEDTIQINFSPKGKGWQNDPFHIEGKDNICCCCGSEKELTKHHVVPYCYRKQFPDQIKNSNSYDILPVCSQCHSKYEKFAEQKKEELANKFNAPVHGINNITRLKAPKIAHTLLTQGHSLPEDIKKKLIDKINRELCKENITEEDLRLLIKAKNSKTYYKFISHAEKVVSQIKCLQTFVEEWRTHFVNTMNPKHLPEKWDIKKTIYRQT